MTISRDELSNLFNDFLDDVEKHNDNAADIEKEAHQVETQIASSPDDHQSSRLTLRLRDILQDIDHVESRLEDDGMTPPTVLEEAKTADELLAELLKESLEHHEDQDAAKNQTHMIHADGMEHEILDDIDNGEMMQPPPTMIVNKFDSSRNIIN